MSPITHSFRFLAPILAMVAVAGGCATVPAAGEDVEGSEGALQEGVVGNLKGKTVLILPFAYSDPGETSCFMNNAKALLKWYGDQGADKTKSKVVQIGTQAETTPEMLFSVLEAEKAAGRTYDRVITMSHGGLDGPIFSTGQIGLSWPEAVMPAADSAAPDGGTTDESEAQNAAFEAAEAAMKPVRRAKIIELGSLLNAITKPKSFIYLGSCNSGTPTSEIDPAYNYVQLTTCLSGRASFGTATITSCIDAGNRIKRLERADVSNMLKEGDPSLLPASQAGFTCVTP